SNGERGRSGKGGMEVEGVAGFDDANRRRAYEGRIVVRVGKDDELRDAVLPAQAAPSPELVSQAVEPIASRLRKCTDLCARSGPTFLCNPARSPLLLGNHHRFTEHLHSPSAQLPLPRRTRQVLHCLVKHSRCSCDPPLDAIDCPPSTRADIQWLLKTTGDRPASSYLLVRTAPNGIATIIRASV